MSSVAHTRTGGFTIGLRLTGTLAARPVAETAAWAKASGFACVDIFANQRGTIREWAQAGVPVGTIDLFNTEWVGMLSADAGKRKATVAIAQQAIRETAAAGAKILFGVMLAEDVNLPRKETFRYMVESYGQIRDTLKETDTRLAIEGWPGCNAHCCNPESYRAFLKETASPHFGINYDPSHLIHMGIDPLRFVKEFAPHVVHMHGKDTFIDAERLYNIGTEQAGAFGDGLPWGGWFWRYTIPGAGRAPWSALFAELKAAGYQGHVSIELEDGDYNGTIAGEQRGFLAARDFLQSA
ncbi:MAG: sugar phosphate isomerase/epimerase [Proteobacteria bacterium]|nr:sugar phosphate isomerase/epimerase [Pseudomonadota bacterium]